MTPSPPIINPYIRDEIVIDDAFSERVAAFGGDGSLYILARRITQESDLAVGRHPLVIVADEFAGNGLLINAAGASSASPGSHGADAGHTPPGFVGGAGENGGNGGAGANGGTVTVMCRHSSGVRISVSGGAGAAGGAGGNGGPGSPAKSIPGGTHKETQFDSDGNPFEVEVQDPDIEIPGTLGGGGGIGGDGGAGGNAGTITFTSIADDSPPVLEATGGPGGSGGAGGIAGPNGAFAEVPSDLDTTPRPGSPGAFGADGTINVVTVSEQDYIAGLRPLLDAEGPSYANFWAPYRKAVGQYFYRQLRGSQTSLGELAATELARCLELQPDNVEALQWQHQLMDFPRPVAAGPTVEWSPGGLNALGLPRDLDVLPQFKAYREAFTTFGALVLDFLAAGQDAILQAPNLDAWRGFLNEQHDQAVAAQESSVEDRDQASTDARLAQQAVASAQAQLDQTTHDIQAALAQMHDEDVDIGGLIGKIAGVAGAVVAVVAAVPSLGASLVALVPSMVALSSAVVDNLEPIAQKVMAGKEPDTTAIKKAYEKVDTQAAAVVKGAKAIVDFVNVVEKLGAAHAAPDNTQHLALVRQGVQQTYELLLARQRVTASQQRLGATEARVTRAADAVAGIDAIKNDLTKTEEALRATALHAIAIAESKADALLTLAFYAQRSVEIYTLTDQEEKVRLETGHLHPDVSVAYQQGEINEVELSDRLNDSWQGLLDLLDLELEFDRFSTQFHEPDQRRLSFNGDAELAALRATHRLPFRIDPASLPADQVDAKVQGVRLALVGATNRAGEVTCEITHGSAYETRRSDGSIDVTVLQARTSNRNAKLQRLLPDEGFGSDPVLTDPTSLAFWGRGVGGEWTLSIPDHAFEEGLDLTGLTEVQIWIAYQFLR